jgi:hypothetical protein
LHEAGNIRRSGTDIAGKGFLEHKSMTLLEWKPRAPIQFEFYGYTVRTSIKADFDLALDWVERRIDATFWLWQSEIRESYLVLKNGQPCAFFQSEFVDKGQIRLHWQPNPHLSPKMVLRMLTALVPLIEEGLARCGAGLIIFTSHSPAMAHFMQKRFGYSYAGDGGPDGAIMAKGVRRDRTISDASITRQ